MEKKLCVMLSLVFALLLCACTHEVQKDDSTIQSVYEEQNTEISGTETTMPAAMEETEAAPMTTEPTVPLHSDLYHPDYTLQQIREFFEEVILDVEYSSGTGDSSLVQKWISPIGYRIFGTPTEEDLTVLDALFTQLNELPGFPGIYEASEGDTEQLRISFLEPEVFRASYSSVVGGEDATGATEFWYYTDTNEIHSARIGYRTDIDQSIRNSVLIEEIINTLGISDTVLREDSVTYQYSDFNTALSDVDWILLKLLYHPEIRCGMDAAACAAALEELYY